MQFEVRVVRDYEQMSRMAAAIVLGKMAGFAPSEEKPYLNILLPTGHTAIRLDELIIENQDLYDASIIVSHNLDEYIGLPGKTPTDRLLHPESYARFMIEHLFGKLKKPFYEGRVPRGCEVEQSELERELQRCQNNPAAYHYEPLQAGDNGRAIVIPDNSSSNYLRDIKNEFLDSYLESIKSYGKVDLAVVGVGGMGHIAFHESGIPLNLEMLLVELALNTIENAVIDRHFPSIAESPKYAISLGAGFIYNPECTSEILLLANGKRKAGPIAAALLGGVSADVPISGCQEFAEHGKVIWVIDEEAAEGLNGAWSVLQKKGIQVVDLRQKCTTPKNT